MKTLTATLLAIVVAISLFCSIAYAIKKSEQNECKKWARQAQEYPMFYYTEWQQAQCNIAK